jgi:hypothetical protein
MEKNEVVSNDTAWKLKKQVAVRSRFVFIPQEECAERTAGFIKQHVSYLQLYKLSGLYQKERVLSGTAMFRM